MLYGTYMLHAVWNADGRLRKSSRYASRLLSVY